MIPQVIELVARKQSIENVDVLLEQTKEKTIEFLKLLTAISQRQCIYSNFNGFLQSLIRLPDNSMLFRIGCDNMKIEKMSKYN